MTIPMPEPAPKGACFHSEWFQPCDELPGEAVPCTHRVTHVAVVQKYDLENGNVYEELLYACAEHVPTYTPVYEQLLIPFTLLDHST